MSNIRFIGTIPECRWEYIPPQKHRAFVSMIACIGLLAILVNAHLTLSISKPIFWTTIAIVSLSILAFGYLSKCYYKIEHGIEKESNIQLGKVCQPPLQMLILEFFSVKDFARIACTSKTYRAAMLLIPTPLAEIGEMARNLKPFCNDFLLASIYYIKKKNMREIMQKIVAVSKAQYRGAPIVTFTFTVYAKIDSKKHTIISEVDLINNKLLKQWVEPPLPSDVQIANFSPFKLGSLLSGLKVGELEGDDGPLSTRTPNRTVTRRRSLTTDTVHVHEQENIFFPVSQE